MEPKQFKWNMTDSASTKSLTVETLVGSGFLSSHNFLFYPEAPLDSTDGIPTHLQHHDASGEKNPPLHVRNAIKISLMLCRAFVQCYDDSKHIIDLTSLQLKDFVVKISERHDSSQSAGHVEFPIGQPSNDTSSNNGSTSTQWILLDMHVDCPTAGNLPVTKNMNMTTMIQSIGKLLFTVFTQSDDIALEAENEVADRLEGPSTQHTQKSRRSTGRSLFEKLIESEYPISICRLLNDLVDNGRAHQPITSFDEIICDLEHMDSQPHLFLNNPESDFYTTTLQFGQRYYGRSEELAKLLEISSVPNEQRIGLDVVFISGIAGSGKSHLCSAVGTFISNLGCMVLTAKFNRGMEYNSREVLSGLFDRLVSNLVEMRDSGNESDADYSSRATQAISNALDADSLSSFVDFAPSIQRLIPDISRNDSTCSHWQLIFLLSKLLGCVLSLERKMFMVLDDIQWGGSMLGLMSEVFLTICKEYPEERKRLILVGTYRKTSCDLQTFISSFVKLQQADVTELKLSTFSRDDVVEMCQYEMRLPRRLVSELASVVHKRAHGHLLYIVQLLNSLVSDGIISYSPSAHRHDWDQDKVNILDTPDTVAKLIVSNLSSLPDESLQCLKIMACFGIQIQLSLLELLSSKFASEGGFERHLPSLINQGIIDLVGPLVVFCHDLIQEQVLKSLPMKDQQQLHLQIGIFLGSKTTLDSSSENKPVREQIEQLFLSDTSDNEETYIGASTLISLATSQVNHAGPESIQDRRSVRFARWNLSAAKDASKLSSFRTALHYYKHGISWLGNGLWLDDCYELCLKLHQGAAFSSYALGETNQVAQYANDIIANVTSFEDSLTAQYLLICSLTASAQYHEAVARGVAVLRKLNFDIPTTPSPPVVVETMKKTQAEASLYNISQIADYQKFDSKKRSIVKISEAIFVAAYNIASPFLPLVACETIRFCLQNGAVCEESASAFVVFAYFQVALKQSFDAARYWGLVAKKLLEKCKSDDIVLRASIKLFGFVWFWYVPLQDTVNHLQEVFESSLKVGETESAYVALCLTLRFSFFRGEQLLRLSSSFENHLQAMSKFSIGSAGISAVDKGMIDQLTGNCSNPYSTFNVNIHSGESFIAYSKSKGYSKLVEAAYEARFMVSFWMGDYLEAEKNASIAMSLPGSKMPKANLIFYMFYKGIVAFTLYRDGKGEKWLDEGKETLDQMEIWVNNSKPIFENKLILLEAENYASMCNIVAAKESYELSVQVARDNGYIHEQGLAYECMGKFLKSIVEVQDAERCFMNAYECYMQWGAIAKAAQLYKEHNLDSCTETFQIDTTKHKRDK